MVTDHDAPYISMDPVDIERIATNHYQSSAGIPPDDVSIPTAWIDEFNPKSHIDASNYQDLMNPITEVEYSQIISALPTNKASSPSTITYESVKHAGPLYCSLIITLLNACLDTTLISHSWRQALLFLIPKPMDWECHIDKIQPIVLLEILRKILGKIFTQRISHIFVSHNILKGGNYAGLPGGSTFDPIHTINLIREDAMRNNKEV